MTTRDSTELRRAALRLAVQFAVLIVVLLGLVGVLLYSIVAASSAESTNETLREATRIDSPQEAPLGVFVSFLAQDRVLSSRIMPEGLPDAEAMGRVADTGVEERRSLSIDGRTFDVLTSDQGNRVVQVAVDTHEAQEQLDRLVWAMVVAMAAATLLAAIMSVWMARRAMRPMADSLALQRRFVADASHELRTPLTLLSTRAQLLRRRLDQTATEFTRRELSTEVSHMVDDARLLAEILDDMLLTADPRDVVNHTAIDLVRVARDAVDLARPQAIERKIELELSDSAEVVEVQGSPVALLRVFSSVISNALDHARTKVTVTVLPRGSNAHIVISDDGPGFAPGSEKRVLERFSSTRERSGDADSARHYGLGLALAAEIAAHHRGSIQVGPAHLGQGGTVTVILPRTAR